MNRSGIILRGVLTNIGNKVEICFPRIGDFSSDEGDSEGVSLTSEGEEAGKEESRLASSTIEEESGIPAPQEARRKADGSSKNLAFFIGIPLSAVTIAMVNLTEVA